MDSITINGKEYKYKDPVCRITIAVELLDKQMREIGSKQKRFDEDKKVEVEENFGMFSIFRDEKKVERFAPIWKQFVELVIESPDKIISDFYELTERQVLDIRAGFFFAADPLRERIAALKPSDDSEPKPS